MICIDLWLYGPLAVYGGDASQRTHANVHLEMPDGATMRDLIIRIGLPLEEKGITFVNGQLTDMPGLAADSDRVLADGDRVGIFSPRSMWPFQYRFGASTSPELLKAMEKVGGQLHHSPASVKAKDL